MVLVDFQVEGCALRLYHFCQGGYVDMHAYQNIFRDCVDKLWMGDKPEILKKVGHSIVGYGVLVLCVERSKIVVFRTAEKPIYHAGFWF